MPGLCRASEPVQVQTLQRKRHRSNEYTKAGVAYFSRSHAVIPMLPGWRVVFTGHFPLYKTNEAAKRNRFSCKKRIFCFFNVFAALILWV